MFRSAYVTARCAAALALLLPPPVPKGSAASERPSGHYLRGPSGAYIEGFKIAFRHNHQCEGDGHWLGWPFKSRRRNGKEWWMQRNDEKPPGYGRASAEQSL